MTEYRILVPGNNLRLADGFLGLANISLVDTPDGPMLFDVGHFVNRTMLLSRLKAEGLSAADIRYVFLSHLHFDHAINVDLFSRATVFASHREWHYAAAPHRDDHSIPAMIRELIGHRRLELLEGEHEILPGLRQLAVPGHTPGSIALTFESGDKGRIVIAGDAIKYPKEVIARRCDMAFATVEEGTKSIERIAGMADRIVPGHFPELIRQADGSFIWEESASFELLVR